MRGIALEGGGAKGSYHIGALKALRDLGIDYQVITGTSIGAINGALILSEGLDRAEKIWLSTELNDVVNGDAELIRKILNYEFKEDAKKVRAFIIDMLKQGGVDISPFKDKMRAIVSEDKVRASDVDFGLVALSLTDLRPVTLFKADIPEGKMHDYIFASSNLPAFKDEKFDDKRMIDGAFYDNLPINMLIDRGCDDIIAIRLNATGRIKRVKRTHQHKVTMISPSEPLGRSMEVDPEKAAYNIRMGYFDTERVIKGLFGTQYYVTNMMDESIIVKKFLNISDATVEKLSTFLNTSKKNKRLIFEEIVPMIASLLKIEDDLSYGEVFLRYYEFLASEIHLERFKWRSYDEFVNTVDAIYQTNYEQLCKTEKSIAKRLFSILPNKSVLLLPKKMQKLFLVNLYLILMNDVWNPSVPK